ncbi:type II toxin-antitoxin system MqsR family toxin [Dyella sp.]|jgi:hypothetical protein|uniref:type II toxin-antitoxin system MqsR family toxin n=1 Tax=Dyella sp. TaxID=1869338 RepID=UPI002BFE9AF3|nr:type II toxin-antitoxin system MqsR family toxin [Dyella sp.]HTC27251.1 type II toxin-antitoxin system MqsR family toxin [Dyella sp.]
MVSSNNVIETKDVAEYDLQAVFEHARAESIHFGDGPKLLRHLARLGFPASSTNPVCEVLLTLTEKHFHRCERYEGDVRYLWHDVYLLPKFQAPNGDTYNMYIKIRMTSARTMTIVCSFHPEGWE